MEIVIADLAPVLQLSIVGCNYVKSLEALSLVIYRFICGVCVAC